MNKEQLRMQMLAGVITEGQYKEKLEENSDKIKYLEDALRNVWNIIISCCETSLDRHSIYVDNRLLFLCFR